MITLAARSLAATRAWIASLSDDVRAELSPHWLAQLDDPAVDVWTLGFDIIRSESGTPVGSCGFKGPPDANGIVEIAYGVDPEHQGHGYATAAARALTAFAVNDRRVRLVCAHTVEDDGASAHVLRKCGFTNVGRVVDPEDGPVWRWERDAAR